MPFADQNDHPKLNWIVPLRRAVVTGRMPLRDAFCAWAGELQQSAATAALQRWYSLSPDAVRTRAIPDLARFIYSWYPELTPTGGGARVAARSRQTVRVPADPHTYQPRIWAGTLRVLLPVNAENPALDCTDAHELAAPQTELLAGDVIEFPVHTFLAAGGLTDYANIEFNPDGSFLLGDELIEGSDSPPTDHPIHDNRAGMRLQLLIDVARGSFARLNDALYAGFNLGKAPRASVDGHTVHARGMMYAGVLGNERRGGDDEWALHDMRWGTNAGGGRPWNLPARNKLAGQVLDSALTPGWSCSPTALLMSNFMMDNRNDGGRGAGSVGNTVTSGSDSVVNDNMVPVDMAAIRTRLDAARENATDDLEPLGDDIDELVAELTGDACFGVRLWDEAVEQNQFEGVRPATLRTLRNSRTTPQVLMRSIWQRTRRATRQTPEAEREALRAFFRRLAEACAEALDELRDLQQSDRWLNAGLAPIPENVMENQPTASRSGFRAYPWWNYPPIVRQLRARKAQLLRVIANGATGAYVDLRPLLGDVNAVSLSAHEFVFLKLHRPDRLLRESSLPRAGFLTVYDPLSGEDVCEGLRGGAQGYLFELNASGGLGRMQPAAGQTHSTFSGAPTIWRAHPNGRVFLQVQGQGLKIRPGGGNGSTLGRITKLPHTALRTLHERVRRSLPIVIHRPPGRGGGLGDPVVDTAVAYRERAVPVPTYAEAAPHFPTIRSLIPHMAQAYTTAQGIDRASLSRTWQNHLDRYLNLMAPAGGGGAAAAAPAASSAAEPVAAGG